MTHINQQERVLEKGPPPSHPAPHAAPSCEGPRLAAAARLMGDLPHLMCTSRAAGLRPGTNTQRCLMSPKPRCPFDVHSASLACLES